MAGQSGLKHQRDTGYPTGKGRLSYQYFVEQPIGVDNRLGTSSNIGGELAARVAADGYTPISITASLPANHVVEHRIPYDLTRDFAYITQMTTQSYELGVHPSIPAATVKVAGVMLGSSSMPEIEHVPYKGGVPAGP